MWRKMIFRLVALAHQVWGTTTVKRALSHCQKRKQYTARVSSIADSLYTHPMEPPFSHLFTSSLSAKNNKDREGLYAKIIYNPSCLYAIKCDLYGGASHGGVICQPYWLYQSAGRQSLSGL